jgi:hypothetical protein
LFSLETCLIEKRSPTKFVKKIKSWHLLCGITLWTFWIKHNDKVFNHEPWHESKVKHLVWDDLVIYTKAAWERVVKQVKISIFCVGSLSTKDIPEASTKCGVLGMSFVEGTIHKSLGIGNGNAIR